MGYELLDAEVGVVGFGRWQVGRYRNHKSAGTVTRPVNIKLILRFVSFWLLYAYMER